VFAAVRSKSNYSLFSGGVAGETSTQIKTRFLAASDATRGQKTSIWAGRNNFADPTTVKADIAAMVAAFTGTNYIVLSVFNGAGQGIGTPEYDTIIQLNLDLAATYGSHYYDMRAFFVAQYDPNNAQDVIDHAADITPTSLRTDTQHPNAAGYTLIGNKLVDLLGLIAATDGP
jgi:lysophospholipase L1-like esterase